MQSHQHYKSANLAKKGIAENELPWWPGSSVRSVIERRTSLDAGGGAGWRAHCRRSSVSRRQAGCGVFVNGKEITVVQNFR